MVIGLGAALAGAVLFGLGAVVQAVAARRGPLVSRLMALVVLMYIVGWLLHLLSIALVPLYVAQVGTATSLAFTALAAARVVGEPLARRHWVAIAALVAGLALLAVAAGPVGHHRFEAPHALILVAALVLLLVLGLAAARVPGQRGGVLLGCVAGVAYAGSPLASRALVGFRWDWPTVVSCLTVGLFGLLGFWLYSLALRRSAITATTAPLVLLQTVVPAAVGVLAFDDEVRAGWWPLALVGFAVSTAAAVALCDAEARLEHLPERHADPMVGYTP
jgi:drug/metabolite transporter (DMT)-like permease